MLSELSRLFAKDKEFGGAGALCVCTKFTSFLVWAHHYSAHQCMNKSLFLMKLGGTISCSLMNGLGEYLQ